MWRFQKDEVWLVVSNYLIAWWLVVGHQIGWQNIKNLWNYLKVVLHTGIFCLSVEFLLTFIHFNLL
jgi:hypothetical protein